MVHIKVYIFGIEVSRRIYFLVSNFTLKFVVDTTTQNIGCPSIMTPSKMDKKYHLLFSKFIITIWHYAPPVVRAIAKFKFCQKVTERSQKTYVFSRTSKKARDRHYKWVHSLFRRVVFTKSHYSQLKGRGFYPEGALFRKGNKGCYS